jgi:hypothetical protein
MRIIIESTEREGVEKPIHESIQPSQQIEATDGGAPSEALIQAIAEAPPISAESEGTDAGSPPQWLLEAIEGAIQPLAGDSGADTDAGSAPGSED